VSDIVVGMLNGLLCALLAWNWLRREPASGSASSDVETRGGSTGETAQTRA
jgi:hypothetical protein